MLMNESPQPGSSNIPGSYSLVGNPLAASQGIAFCVLGRTSFAFLSAIAALLLLAPVLSGQQSDSKQPEATTLRGVVRDVTGSAVADAHVVLQGVSPPLSREETTDSSGQFTFKDVVTGTFTLTVNSGSLKNATVTVTVSSLGEQPIINVVLGSPQSKTRTTQDASQAMQFADQPDFAIAAVTDWTAAGGHGSDASLRTSEALTQQAVNLKSSNTAPTAGPSDGSGRPTESEGALRAAVAKDPKGFEANSALGHFYAKAGRYQDAIQPLQVAYQANPTNSENELDLAHALEMTGNAQEARDHVRRLLTHRENAELHRMEGELDEKLGDPLAAVHAFQQAASMDPSEENYFSWGSELLIHRAVWQAKEVFDEGAKQFPQSVRMLTARGAALFAGALYDDAALDLCRASDLSPDTVEPYLFMGKIEIVAPNPLPCVVEKLARFEKLQSANSLAHYYYAMALKKQQGRGPDARAVEQVKDQLTRAVTLDPKCAEGYFELGNLSASDKQWEQARTLYLQAIQADPELSDAHYRLGVVYQRTGEQDKARDQFQLHDAIAGKQAAEIQRQREAVKQFLVVLPNQTGTPQAK
jgi:tetratricopeptide (TPR) repeat protein